MQIAIRMMGLLVWLLQKRWNGKIWQNRSEKTGLLNNKTLWCRGWRVRRMNMRRRKVRKSSTDFIEWTCLDNDMQENGRNIEKRFDCWCNGIRQHKETLSRVSGKRKKKYYLRWADVCIDKNLRDQWRKKPMAEKKKIL